MTASLTCSHIRKQNTLSSSAYLGQKLKRFLYGNVSFPIRSGHGHAARFPLSEPNISTYWSPPLWCNTRSTFTLTSQTYSVHSQRWSNRWSWQMQHLLLLSCFSNIWFDYEWQHLKGHSFFFWQDLLDRIWNQSQLTLGEGEGHPGQVASSSQGF